MSASIEYLNASKPPAGSACQPSTCGSTSSAASSARGYEAVATCFAPPEVRERIARRPEAA